MLCSCVDGTPCELELELREKVAEALHQFDSFPGPSTQVAVAVEEQPLFEHRRDVQHALYGALLVASDNLTEAEKEIPRWEARRTMEEINALYREAKAATRAVAPWTRLDRLYLSIGRTP